MTTVLNDAILPDRIMQMGVQGKSRRINERTRSQGGFPLVTIIRGTLREFTFGAVPLRPQDWQTVEALWERTAAGAYGMLVRDPKDSQVRAGEGFLQPFVAGAAVGAAGVGYGVPVVRTVQRKLAIDSATPFDRLITRPDAGSPLLRNGVAVTLGGGAGQAAFDVNTGTVTFVPDASQGVTVVTPGATTQVTLGGPLSGVNINGRLYLQGLGGADAALLNGKSHEVTNKAGSVYTLATNTAGKSITASGLGYQFPQPSETLTWSGKFRIPVQFSSDDLEFELIKGGQHDTRLIVGPSVTLIEIPER